MERERLVQDSGVRLSVILWAMEGARRSRNDNNNNNNDDHDNDNVHTNSSNHKQ